jgi:peptidoglycan/xylan/chitin deacetylase (PgdA/CDA1 family)
MEEKPKITQLNSGSMLIHLASAGLISGLAAGAYAYAARWPTSQLFGRTVLAGSDVRQVALTFDDGPNDPYTHQLLDLLARHQVRATFFLMGSYVRQRPEIARAIHQAGHLLGNHTMTHPSLMWERPLRVREELASCQAAIEDATGEAVRWFRPPFGSRRPDVLRTASELGLTPVMWNVTGYDWDETDANALKARVQRGLRRNHRHHRGSNILLHDGGHRQLGTDRSVTLKATRMLLESWAGSTFSLVTVDAWRKEA